MQGLERGIQQKSAEWYEARKSRLTASEIGAAIGVNPYCSRQKLWRIKTGREPVFLGNEATDRGEDHEQDAIFEYEVRTGNIVLPAPLVLHPAIDFLAASPDGYINSDGLIEAKCPTNGVHDHIPDHYYAQIQCQLECTARFYCVFASWYGDQSGTLDYRDFIVFRDERYWNQVLPLATEFWDYVKRDVEPPRFKRKPTFERKQ